MMQNVASNNLSRFHVQRRTILAMVLRFFIARFDGPVEPLPFFIGRKFMYLIRETNGRIVYLNKEKTAFILCENENAVDSAVEALERMFGIKCVPDKVDSVRTAGHWFLRRQDGTKVGEEVGARIALHSEKAAKNFCSAIRLKTNKLLTPIPA